MTKQSVHIIGGGPAGLSAAHDLVVNSDIEVVVCEKSTMVGGISRTESYKGYLVDVGGHRFFTKNRTIQKLWNTILGNDFIKVLRISRIYYKQKFYHYPIRLLNTLLNLGMIESFRIVISYLAALAFPCPEENTFEQWVSNRFGKRLYLTFFKTYTEKVWGIPCSSIQADWASQRIRGLSLKAAFVKAVVGKSASKTLIEAFDYPILGPGMMWNGFKNAIEERGGSVLMQCEVKRIRHSGNRITGIDCRLKAEPMSVTVDHLISSMPITRLTALLDPSPPDYVARAADRLTYRSFIIVLLIITQKNLFPDQWIYIHSPEVHVGRIQNFKNWSAQMLPDAGTTSLGFEYFCNEADTFWNTDDKRLTALAAKELEMLGFASKTEVIDSYIIRQPNAYPVYDETYKENISILRKYLAMFKNLQTIGRNGMHRYNNMDHSMITGIMAARNVKGACHDVWDVNEEDDYLEDGSWTQIMDSLDRLFPRLHKRAFGTATGITLGLCIFFATVFIVLRGGETNGATLSLLNQFFSGYSVSYSGSVVGLAYGFLTGFTGGWLFALLRNIVVLLQFNLLRSKTDRVLLKDFMDYF